MARAVIVQLPFPSTQEPDQRIVRYYKDYDRLFRTQFEDYFVPEGSLWEMPLWVAHLTALVRAADMDSVFCDLSRHTVEAGECAERILDSSAPRDLILMSPLAQNFVLALDTAKILESAGRRVVLGGNMAPLAEPGSVHLVHRGQLDRSLVDRLTASSGGISENTPQKGKSASLVDWVPDYRHLTGYRGQVPLLRLNASHGCLYACSFCGDAWSRQLVLVHRDTLAAEVDELGERFPGTRLIFIGDKTFGQSPEAVRNLIDVFSTRPGYRFIVQTHVMQVRPWVIDAMGELGVVAAELGFESGDSQMLKRLSKLSRGLDDYARKIAMISAAGIRVVLNVMGGLDEETEYSHRETVDWLWANRSMLWLFNLYNFVPYPLIPDFTRLRPRIFDWDFRNWREDLPPVYRPGHLTPERSWELFGEKTAVAHRIVRAALSEIQQEELVGHE
jgi:hypothetical protein